MSSSAVSNPSLSTAGPLSAFSIPTPGTLPSPLLLAVWNKDTQTVRNIINYTLSSSSSSKTVNIINQIGPNGETALHLALRIGAIDIAKILLESGEYYESGIIIHGLLYILYYIIVVWIHHLLFKLWI